MDVKNVKKNCWYMSFKDMGAMVSKTYITFRSPFTIGFPVLEMRATYGGCSICLPTLVVASHCARTSPPPSPSWQLRGSRMLSASAPASTLDRAAFSQPASASPHRLPGKGREAYYYDFLITLLQILWTSFNIALFHFFLPLQGPSEIDDISVQNLL